MSGNTLFSTPRRGEGKKKNRATEDMDDDSEDREIQKNLEAIRKAEAAAERTMREMGIAVERDIDSNNRSASVPTNKISEPI